MGVASSVARCASSGDASDGVDTAVSDSPTEAPTDTASTESGTPAMNAPFEHAGTVEPRMVVNGDYPADDDPADGYPPAFSVTKPLGELASGVVEG